MIEYIFKMGDGESHTFRVDLERSLDESLDDIKGPQWTRIDFHQCDDCIRGPTALDVEAPLISAIKLPVRS